MPLLFIPLKEQFGLSYSQLGILVSINFITQLIFDIIFSKPVDKYGFRPFIFSAHILCVIGFLMLSLTPIIFKDNIYFGLVLSTLVFSSAGGLLELLISPIIDSIPSDNKASDMSLLHSFYAWGQFIVITITSLFLFIFGMDKWNIIVFIWIIPAFLNIFIFMNAPLVNKVSSLEVMKIRDLFKSPIFIIAFFAIMFGASSEVTINQWASTFMSESLLIPKVYADIIGMGSFAIMLGLGRVIYGKYGSKIDVSKIMIIGSFCSFICYIIIATSKVSEINILASALCGIFVSLLWPGTLVVASEKLPLAGASMFALLAASGDFGASLGPWFVGFITDSVNSSSIFINYPEDLAFRISILIASIFPVLTMLFHILLKNKKI